MNFDVEADDFNPENVKDIYGFFDIICPGNITNEILQVKLAY